MKQLLISLLFICFGYNAYSGGGWTSKKGEGYFKLGQTALYADRLYNQSGGISDITTTGIYITSIYGEYGLSNRWELSTHLPVFFRTTINEVRFRSGRPGIPGDEFNHYGDPSIGLKYGLIHDKPFVLAPAIRFDFPLGSTDGGESKIIQTGDGEFNQLLTISAGYVFKGNKVYMTGHLGINNRTKKFSDEFHYHYEMGYRIFPSLLVIGKLVGVESFFNGHVADNASGIFSNNMEQLVVHPQLAYTFKNNFGIAMGSAIPLKGKNILADPIYDFSLFYQLRK